MQNVLRRKQSSEPQKKARHHVVLKGFLLDNFRISFIQNINFITFHLRITLSNCIRFFSLFITFYVLNILYPAYFSLFLVCRFESLK